MPDPVLGERGCAFVVPVDGSVVGTAAGSTLTLADLTAHLERAGLARQKFPERLALVDRLPMTASGKVQKYVLRQRIADQLAAEPVAGTADP